MREVAIHISSRLLCFTSILLVLFICIAHETKAQQDGLYSQFMFNKVVVNSATAGIDDGLNAVLLYKRQWASMPGAPRGYSFSVDGPWANKLINGLGVGLHLVGDRFGPNSNTGFFGSISYLLNLGSTYKLSLGVKGGVKSYSINWARIEYASGYKGGDFYSHSTSVPTVGLGFHLASKRWHIGLATDNLTKPALNLQKSGTTLYGTLYGVTTIYTGYRWSVNDKLDIEPYLMMKDALNDNTDVKIGANITFNKFWVGGAIHSVGVDILAGVNVNDHFMLGMAFTGSTSDISASTGGSYEIILAYNIKRKESEVVLHLVAEDGAVIMIAKKGKSDYFYFEQLPDQSSFIFKMESDDPELLKLTKEVEVRYKNSKGEEVIITVSKDKDEFFRYTFLPPIEEEKLFAVNQDGDTVGVALRNSEGYFIFEYLPNDQNLIFVQSDNIVDVAMVMMIFINDKSIQLRKGEDKFFRFEELPPEIVILYLIGEDGDTLSSGGLNLDGFFVFEKLPVDQSYIFFLNARDLDLIDEVQILSLDEQGNKTILTLAKGEDKFFRFQQLDLEETRLYLINDKGDTLMSTTRNLDGFFVFEKLPVDQNFLFLLDGVEIELIEDILILTKDAKGVEQVITASKKNGNLFRYESLPSSTILIPGLLEPDEVAFILNTNDQRVLRTTYESLKFNTGEAIIALESYAYLEALGKMLIINKDWRIILSGFTDNVGGDNYNLLLSKQRAETVKRALVKRGVPIKRIRVKFFGETHPLESNDTEQGRQKNRRVEMRIVKVK